MPERCIRTIIMILRCIRSERDGRGDYHIGDRRTLTASFTGLLGLILLFSRWEPGSWPGDDPTQAPGDGFEWRGPGEIGSSKGEWYNPSTGDQLHPDLNHPLPKGPHWGWKNKILKILKDIFKGGK